MLSEGRFRLAVDVGGTFMDFVLLDEVTGAMQVEKVSSIQDDLPAQFVEGLQSFGVSVEAIRQIFHGMTVGVNALIQEKGAPVGLITTKGFRDVLQIGRGGRKPVYNFIHRLPEPIVSRELRREVSERVSNTGEIIKPLDLDELDREVDFLLSKGVETIAIAFLHSYAQPSHETAAKKRIAERYPNVPVSVSHEIASEWREYERTSTTVLNSFIRPVAQRYLDDLEGKLTSAGYDRPLAVMQSSGGVVDSRTAGEKPIRTLMSGPAGGVIGAKILCERLGYKNVICTDVGGTTYEVAIIEDGKVLERSQAEIGQRPILGSLIDVTSIGAGGGSIAWLDHRGGLQVGPRSAGASPGPVCFGRGGTEPTVTDAHLVLGWLDPAYFLGGRMRLDKEAARNAIESSIAEPLGMNVTAAAQGIIAIAETNMANAIRTKTVERGLDPREFVMLAYGGGGGLFACSVAEELGVDRVIIPNAPANFSAWGILTSDYMEDQARTLVMPFEQSTIDSALQTSTELEERAVAAIRAYGFADEAIERLRRFDLRFKNQEYTLTIALKPEWTNATAILRGAREAFVDEHRRLYGHGDLEAELELVSVRCRAIGRVQAPKIEIKKQDGGVLGTEQRPIFYTGSAEGVPTRIIERSSLSSDVVNPGPLIINEWTMTTVVPPKWQASLDEFGNLILEPREASENA